MPSPESPAKRRTTRSSSRVGCSRAAVSVKGVAPGRVGCELLLIRQSAYRQVPPRTVFWNSGGGIRVLGLPFGTSAGRRVEDGLNGLVERGIELGVALLRRQALGQRAREAGDHAVVRGQLGAGVLPRVSA